MPLSNYPRGIYSNGATNLARCFIHVELGHDIINVTQVLESSWLWWELYVNDLCKYNTFLKYVLVQCRYLIFANLYLKKSLTLNRKCRKLFPFLTYDICMTDPSQKIHTIVGSDCITNFMIVLQSNSILWYIGSPILLDKIEQHFTFKYENAAP